MKPVTTTEVLWYDNDTYPPPCSGTYPTWTDDDGLIVGEYDRKVGLWTVMTPYGLMDLDLSLWGRIIGPERTHE